MIRPPAVTVAFVATAIALTSGCGTFTTNTNAASVGDAELSIDDLGTLATELGNVGDSGEMTGELARLVLSEWVESQLLLDGLAQEGIVVDQQALDAAAAELEAGVPQWAEFSEATQTFLIESRAADAAAVTDDQVRAIYETGAGQSGILCLRYIVVETQEAADEIFAELEAGADFAELADEHPPPGADPATLTPGGVFVNPETGALCVSAAGIAPELTPAFAVGVGEPSPPIQFQDSFVIFLQRPFDEVADAVRTSLDPELLTSARDEFITEATNVRIDSRYGMWDSTTGRVVPAR